MSPDNRALAAEIKLHLAEEIGDLREALMEKIGELRTDVAVLQDREPVRPRAPLIAGASAGGLVAVAAHLLQQLLGIGGPPPTSP